MAQFVPFRHTATEIVTAFRAGAFADLTQEARIRIWCDWFTPKAMLPALSDEGIEALGQVLDLGIPGFGDLNVLFKQLYGDTLVNSMLLFSEDRGPTLYQIGFSALSDEDDWSTVENGCNLSITEGATTRRTTLVESGSWQDVLDALREHALAKA